MAADITHAGKPTAVGVYVGPQLAEPGYGFLARTVLSGQRVSSSHLVQVGDDAILLNAAVFKPRSGRSGKGWRLHGLQVVSAHRPTGTGIAMLAALAEARTGLRSVHGDSNRLKPATRADRSYGLPGFVLVHPNAFPFIDGDDPAFQPAAEALFAHLGDPVAPPVPPRPLTLDGRTFTIADPWSTDPWGIRS